MSMTREEAIKQFEERLRVWDKLEVNDDVRDYLEAIKLAVKVLKQPEIIQCKDCKFNEVAYCEMHLRDIISGSGSCSWAERRRV